uniref:Reverse transcriptase domain-containing protein n=1 Tax=Tanacetum cinerariifolium TaxID=118510 RepID=A0A699HP84_TANCI|nr:reverse transcriptase domain-containing protein [Tanacetum cinerariifolium]
MLTCRRTSQVKSYHQNSREAGVSKDMSALSVGLGIPIYPKEGGMVDSYPMEEEFQGAATRDVGTETHEGTIEPQAKMKATPRKLAYANSKKEALAGQIRSTIKSQKTPSKNKEPTSLRRPRRLEDRSTTREKARRERSKSRRKRSGHQETSLESEYKEGQNFPRTSGYMKEIKIQRIIRFDDLDPKSVDSFEELSQKFLKEFSQQNRYDKDPTEIHGIKRRQNKGLQDFMDRFKSGSSHIKGVPPVLRISNFMHGHGHLELAKKLNDKIPKTEGEMFKRVRAFFRGEVAAGSAEMVCPSQGDKGYVCPK